MTVDEARNGKKNRYNVLFSLHTLFIVDGCLTIEDKIHQNIQIINRFISDGGKSICLHGRYEENKVNNSSSELSDRGLLDIIDLSHSQTGISIYGHNARIVNWNFVIRSDSNNLKTLNFVNVTFESSLMILNNVDVNVLDCMFNQTSVRDLDYHEHGKPKPIHFTLHRCLFICGEDHIQEFRSHMQFDSQRTSMLKLSIIESKLSSCRAGLYISGLMLSIVKSLIMETYLDVIVKTYLKIPSIINFTDTDFIHTEAMKTVYPISLYLDNPDLLITNCTFDKYSLKIQASSATHFQQYLFHFEIRQSLFIGSHQLGNGGALFILTDVDVSLVNLKVVNFIENRAMKPYGTNLGHGGAVYIKGDSVHVTIEHCRFQENFGAGSGSSLWTSQGVFVKMISTSFFTSIEQEYPKSAFVILGAADTLMVTMDIRKLSPFTIEARSFEVASVGQIIGSVHLSVFCPEWHKHELVYKLEELDNIDPGTNQTLQTVSNVVYGCGICSEGYYTTAHRLNEITYSPGSINHSQSDTDDVYQHPLSIQQSCEQCPYGAHCMGSYVIPRPNYWGYWYKDDLVFQQCPAGYCCSGGTIDPCDSIDSCTGNRTGTLCGSCIEGFSVSILNGECIREDICGKDHWFWAVAFTATMVYALWYTLKDDIMSLFFKIIKLVPSCFRSEKMNNTSGNNVDKGYFGIVTYFVQMAAVIHIQMEYSDTGPDETFLDTLGNSISQFLNMELTQIELNVCPLSGMTAMSKVIYQLGFLMAIYISWFAIFLVNLVIIRIYKGITNKNPEILESFKLKLVQGFVEIIKYTYAGACGVLFISIVCVSVKGEEVWWYDGTNVCFENWQVAIVAFGIFYVFPLPFALFFGLKMLKDNEMSARMFLCSCMVPLVSLCYMIVHRYIKREKVVADYKTKATDSDPLPVPSVSVTSDTSKMASLDSEANYAPSDAFPATFEPAFATKSLCGPGPGAVESCAEDAEATPASYEEIPATSEAIISVLQGPYRAERQTTLNWEAMISIRRLIITALTLVSHSTTRMTVITILSLVFLCQHIYLKPFIVKTSNYIETLSLSLFLVLSVFNILKGSLADSGVLPSGPNVSFYKRMELFEKSCVLVIILAIMVVEIRMRLGRKRKET